MSPYWVGGLTAPDDLTIPCNSINARDYENIFRGSIIRYMDAKESRDRQKREADKKTARRVKVVGARKKQTAKDAAKNLVIKNSYITVPYTPGMKTNFYATREWRELRWRVISKSIAECVICGRNHKQHGVVLHVDHIKPRSRYPELELDESNMQVLCEDCNLGKGALEQTFP